MLDLYEELRAITRALETAQVPYALIGGIAVSIYASPRATEDVDLLILPADVARCAAALAPLGYRELSVPMTLARGRLELHRLTKLAGDDFMVLDLLLASDSALADMLARRVPVGEGENHLWLVPLDGLKQLKRLRGSPQDLADLAALGEVPGRDTQP